MTTQYLRKASLVVSGQFGGRDLSAMQFRFEIKQADLQTPNRAVIRVFNLSDSTANQIQAEFTQVTLQAGYQDGPYGVIFEGTLIQVRRGKENQTDSYCDLICGDGDEALNFATVSTVITSGSTFKQRIDALQAAMTAQGVTAGQVPDTTPGDQQLSRGRVFWGMVRDHLRVQAFSNGMSFSIQNGVLTMIPLEGITPGEAVVINSNTGMIGLPEQTQAGVKVRCLLNPLLVPGSAIQINQSSIQQQVLSQSFSSDATQNSFPGIASDGMYKVFVIEHQGDTRATPWYSDITALGIDPSTNSLASSLYAAGQA